TQGRYIKTMWKDVRVGDLIHLSCNEVIPADLVVLASSDSYGLCFVESSNLDGESNLKQRQCVRGLGMDEQFEAGQFNHILEVGSPSTKIYHFTGSIPLRSGERVPLTKDNLLLRDCTLRNTDYIEGIVVYAGRETKAMLNNGGTRYKRSKLERQMNVQVAWCVVILFLMCLVSATGSGLWQNAYEMNATQGLVPFIPQEPSDTSRFRVSLANNSMWVGFISFWTFIIIYQVIIPISLYVTIEVIKLMQIYHIHNDTDFQDKKSGKTIECRALNIPEELGQVQYVFTDKTGTLTENNMVFQRCSINAIDYPHHPVITTTDSQKSGMQDTFSLNEDLQEAVSSLELYNSQQQQQQHSAPYTHTHQDVPQPHHDPRLPYMHRHYQAPHVNPYMHHYQQHHTPLASPSSLRDTPNERLTDFFFTMAACNTVVVAKHPHRDQMNASGMIMPSESANTSASEGGDPHNSNYLSSTSASWAPTRVLRSILTFSRPLSPIASSPRSTPPHTPQSSPRYPPFPPAPPPAAAHLNQSQSSTGSASPSPSISITLNPMGTSDGKEVGLDSASEGRSSPQPQRPSLLVGLKPTHVYGLSANAGCDSRSVTPSPLDLKPIYEAESPDELALVDAAYKYGFRLMRRSLHNVLVSLPGYGLCEYEVLHVLPFDSNRKRMSIIVRHPLTQEKILYCKGADSAILDRLARTTDESAQLRILRTHHHLHTYSKIGLRVLCMAKRVLSPREYEEWAGRHKEAENALSNRENLLQDSYCRIEKEFKLLGATGIEDRLQEGVPETIQAMRGAGIVVWVLTGDKQETAVNIAYACALFVPNMEIIMLNARRKDQAERTIHFYLEQIKQREEQAWRQQGEGSREEAGMEFMSTQGKDNSSNGFTNQMSSSSATSPAQRGLVVDGRTLVFILDRRANLKNAFLELAGRCGAVLCCRATPLQKSLIVRSAKDALKVLTLAVGDGANDVSMIQTADVGVGISGLEGRQAVMASDYAIARFRHLEKLLLVHGHWCYQRLTTIILYFFYKNASFVFILLCYQVYNGFSGSSMIDQMYLMVFNLLFTSVPPIFLGIYDQDAPPELLLSQPHLYSQGREGRLYQPHYFWLNILDGAYQAVVLFFFAAVIHQDSTVGMFEFGMTLTHSALFTQLAHIAIESKSWTVIQVFGIVLSLATYYVFGALYAETCVACLGNPSQYGELGHALSSPLHWLTVLLTSVIAILPRFVIRSLQCSFTPGEVTQAVLASRQHQRSSLSRLWEWFMSWWRPRENHHSSPSPSLSSYRTRAPQHFT
ncbi:hypothetical protein Pcinc_037925, partial [Petrolisthes cinctipes]